MKSLVVIPAFLTLIACGGGGNASQPTTGVTQSFSIKCTSSPQAPKMTASSDMIEGLAAPAVSQAVVVNPLDVDFTIGFMGNSNAVITASDSDQNFVLSFGVSTVKDGVTLGYKGVSETLSSTDPSIPNIDNWRLSPGQTASIDWAKAGVNTATGDPGFFNCKFSSTTGTALKVTTANGLTSAKQLNEFVISMVPFNSLPLKTASGETGGFVSAPRFFTGNPYTMYSDVSGPNGTSNLHVTTATSTELVYKIQSILFIPKSKLPAVVQNTFTSAIVQYPSVVNPVKNDAPSGYVSGAYTPTDPTTWTLVDAATWNSNPNNAGILQVVDILCGTDRTTQSWLNTALYFQNYFAKFYRAQSTKFNTPDVNGLFTMNVGASFEIVVFDDVTSGPLLLNGTSTLNLNFDAANTTYSIDNSIMTVTGNPPIKFDTSVTN